MRRSLATSGAACTLGFFNDTEDSADADHVIEQTLQTIDAVAGSDDYVSIKPPAIGFCSDRLQQLAAQARHAGVRLHADSHGPEAADATLGSVKVLLTGLHASATGITLPARWSRSAHTMLTGP